MLGSADLFDQQGRRPWASVNFVTAHDGFTLADLVAYNDKHNEANGEDNRDGHDDNRSWNCGVEGPTDDPAILDLRDRMRRSLLATLLLSQGTPMLLMGDEVGRTQSGNNNAYCQDNEIAWLDWNDVDDRDRAFMEFVRGVIRLRKRYRILRSQRVPARPARSTRRARATSSGFAPDGEEMDDAGMGRCRTPRWSACCSAMPATCAADPDSTPTTSRSTFKLPGRHERELARAHRHGDRADRSAPTATFEAEQAVELRGPVAAAAGRAGELTASASHFRKSWGAEPIDGRRGAFRLWAPAQRARVAALGEGGADMPMRGDGRRLVRAARPTRARRRRATASCWPTACAVPDPAARAQVGDVHGPSRLVDPARLSMAHRGLAGPAVEETVFYELHVGTFTPEGTFDGVRDRLDHLAEPRRHRDRADAGRAVRRQSRLGL